MATIKVLETVELLESILLQLPARDVFIIQRVSKQWRSVIERSVSLQQALFLKPANETATCLPSSGPTTIKAVDLKTPCRDILAIQGLKTAVNCILSLHGSPEHLTGFHNILEDSKLAYAGASWQRMLLVQSPVTEVQFASNYLRKSYDTSSIEFEDEDTGIIMTLSGNMIKQGNIVDLGAFALEGTASITVGDFVQAMTLEQFRFRAAESKGRTYRFAWMAGPVTSDEHHVIRGLQDDIVAVVQQRLEERRRRAEMLEALLARALPGQTFSSV